jgi:ubiquitin C-terminal hydrolase
VLAGIVVHTGTADYGHYYSYLDTNREKEFISSSGKNVDEKWLEFNDSRVTEFNSSNIENECFGGNNSVYSSSSMWGTWNSMN